MTSALPAIGVDWGSTHVRAFRFDSAGAVIETRRGSSHVEARQFAVTLNSIVRDWLGGPDTPIMLCGMIGSREGWIEAPYVACPGDVSAFAKGMVRAPAEFADVLIAPGAKSASANSRFDVMRGEETQILGLLESGAPPALVIAPGTHSKWARLADGALASFRTYMTGEMYAVLKAHSILGRPMPADAPHDEAAFDLGVRRALDEDALLNLIFSVRTEHLFARLAPEALASYLSGVLIGAEIAEASKRDKLDPGDETAVISSSDLAARYGRALALAGFDKVRMVDGEAAAARGLWRLAQARTAL